MSLTVVVRLSIEGYDKFAESFASRAEARAAAGLELNAYRNMDDPNQAVVIGTVPSKEALIEFISTPEQQEAMKNAGIQGPPDIALLEG